MDKITYQMIQACKSGDEVLEEFPDSKEKRLILLSIEMLNAYKSGDKKLDKFPDTLEKDVMLRYIDSYVDKIEYLLNFMIILLGKQDLDELGISSYKTKLKEASNDEERKLIILDIIDNYNVSTDTKELFHEYRYILSSLRSDLEDRVFSFPKQL